MRSNFNRRIRMFLLGAVWAAVAGHHPISAGAEEAEDPAAACRGNPLSVNRAATYINPETLLEADSYSSGVVIAAGRRMAYISGQIPVSVSYDVMGADLRAQTKVVLGNLCAALAAANMTTGDVVRLGIYYVHEEGRNPFEIAEEVIGFFRRDEMPATTMTAVPKIITDNILIQIDAIAVSSDGNE